jgi:hypothetical protein
MSSRMQSCMACVGKSGSQPLLSWLPAVFAFCLLCGKTQDYAECFHFGKQNTCTCAYVCMHVRACMLLMHVLMGVQEYPHPIKINMVHAPVHESSMYE